MNSSNLPMQRGRPSVPAYSQPSGDEPGAGSGFSLRRFAAALLRYRWMLLGTLVIGTAAGIWASRYVPPEYEAGATILIHVPDRNSDNQGPIRSSSMFDERAFIELMRNQAVLLPAVQAERLYLDHRRDDEDLFTDLRLEPNIEAGTYTLVVDNSGTGMELRSPEGVTVERAAVGQPIGMAIGLSWRPEPNALRPGRQARFSVMSPHDATTVLRNAIMPQLAGGRFLNLKYRDNDPLKAARVVNAIADQYVSLSSDLKRAQLVELRDTLVSQLEYARVQLEQAELELNNFLVRTITEPSEASTPVRSGTEQTRSSALDNYFALRISRDQYQIDLDALTSIMQSGSDALPLEALAGVSAVGSSPELARALAEVGEKRAGLRTLLQQYTEEHDAVKRARADLLHLEQQVVPRLTRELMGELRNRVGRTDGLVAEAATELRGIPPRAIEEARLRRSRETAAKLYITLRERFENARLAAETSVADVRILSRAERPQKPASDTRNRVLLMACLASVGLGMGLVFVRDRTDPRIRYAEQVTGDLRLTILGAIPDMGQGRNFLARGSSTDELVEALRGIRLHVAYAHGAAGPMILTITSPGPGDGKTFVASHLATTFANLGSRTLVIDGDTRRGTLHKVLEVDRRPGLTDFLSGRANLAEVIRRTEVEGLDVIASGARHSQTPELLSSPAMGELLGLAKSRYDVVIIDSPPLGAGVDPLVLATLSANVVLVVRPGVTERAMAEAKLDLMDHLPVRVLGAVLNSVGRQSSYKYYSYMPGYEAGREEVEAGGLRQLTGSQV
jgi:polysaccharide biosynthesis transport protein